MTAISIIPVKDTDEKAPQQNEDQNFRRANDKYWMGLFFLMLAFWIVWLVIESQKCPSRKLDIDRNNCKKFPFGLCNKMIFDDEPALTMQIPTIPDTLPSHYIFWGKNWIFDMITCNVAYLDAHYQTSGPIVIWSNALFFIGLLLCSTYAISNSNEAFNCQFAMAGRVFIITPLLSRFMMHLVFGFNSTTLLLLVPEGAFFIILWNKLGGDVHTLKRLFDDCFRLYILMAFIPAVLACCIHLCTGWIAISTWCSPLDYKIFFPIYYFSSAIIHYLLMDLNGPWPRSFSDHKRNFGTACYHATWIFPKLNTLLVIMEPEFRGSPNTTIIDRLSLLSGKFHWMSALATATTGISHSEFIRKLLRLPAGSLPTLQPYRYFIITNMALLAYLLSTNSLMLIYLWALDYFDPSVSMKTYAYILVNFIVHYEMMAIADGWSNKDLLMGTKEMITDDEKLAIMLDQEMEYD